MKKIITILALFALLCASCTDTIIDEQPPLADGSEAYPHQSVAPDTPAVTAPACDSVAELPDIRLEITNIPSGDGQSVTYAYINDTDVAINIMAIPHLEIKTPDGWAPVEFSDNIGFCGTPDCLASNSRSLDWTLDTEYLYGKPLDTGFYRLSFDVVDVNYELADVIFADFEVL